MVWVAGVGNTPSPAPLLLKQQDLLDVVNLKGRRGGNDAWVLHPFAY